MFIKYKITSALFNLVLLLNFSRSDIAFAQHGEIVLGGFLSEESPDYNKMMKNYTILFSRLGYSFKFINLPLPRASIMADTGSIDGEIHRNIKYISSVTNLIRVQEIVGRYEMSCYSTDKNLNISKINYLKNQSMHVVIKRGQLTLETLLNSSDYKQMTYEIIDKDELGIRMVIAGRCRFFIGRKVDIEHIIKNKGYKAYNNGTIYSSNLYMYLHKKHEKLIPSITKTIQQMKKEGIYEM